MQNRLQRALGAAVLMALASPVPAMAQETFLRCSNMIISFNPATQAIVQYDIDGNRLGSLCRLPESQTLTDRIRGRSERTIHTYTDLRCIVNEDRISVSYTWNRVNQWRVAGEPWRDTSRQYPPQGASGLLIDRKTGRFHYHRRSGAEDISGQCEAIERPTPRPNRF